RAAHGRHDRNSGCRLANGMGGKDRAVEAGKIKGARHLGGNGLVVQRQAAIEERLGGRTIGQARIEVMEAVLFGDAARQRALAGSSGTIDGDRECHQPAFTSESSIFAPSPVIRLMNSGKLVAIMVASSTVTGCSETSPMTRKLMAMRWSR